VKGLRKKLFSPFFNIRQLRYLVKIN
jgi:hypothetical protein